MERVLSDRMHRVALLLALSCALLLAACATPVSSYDGSPRQADDHARMLAALDASADAWNRGDLPGHLALYDESVTTMTKNGPRPSIAAIESSFRATYFIGDKPRQSLRMEHVAIRSLSSDSALMTGRFVLSGGAEPELSGWFSLVWLRTPGGWKVVHDHTS
jgi:ketosteroid isomerase-like protein